MNTVGKLMALGMGCLVLSACGGGGDDHGYTITASAGDGGTISPSGAVVVASGKTGVFTLAPNTGYGISSVGGTCRGTLAGNTYTTRATNTDCTVEAAFVKEKTIAACFTAPETVNFQLGGYNTGYHMGAIPPGDIQPPTYPTRSVGPATFNGQSVTGLTTLGMSSATDSNSMYWTITDHGVSMLGRRYNDGTSYIADPAPVIPLDMQPGQSVDFESAEVFVSNYFEGPVSYIFMGFETLTPTLADKTFLFVNVCHFKLQGILAGSTNTKTTTYDSWYAPGYGEIQYGKPWSPAGSMIGSRYSGDL